MEYQVPQFIEVENKIVGPLTLKQFIYIAGGVGLCVVFFSYLPKILAGFLSLIVAGLTIALSFYRVNGKSFIEVLEAGFNYYTGAKLFLWKHHDVNAKNSVTAPVAQPTIRTQSNGPRLTSGKLSELAWSLDVKSMNNISENSDS